MKAAAKKWRATPGYVCACLVCLRKRENLSARRATERKENRDARTRLERTVKGLAEQNAKLEKEVARAYSAEELMALKVGQRVIERASRHLDATWRSQDGREIRVQGMSQAHLLYALAKSERGEYAPRSFAGNRAEALESELLRRLSGVAGTDRQRAAHEREALDMWSAR